jgi:hypothetical protein
MSKTRVSFVLDDSASIKQARIEKDVHQAFNRYLKDFSEESISSGDDISVSLYLFGESINREFHNVPARHISQLARYNPEQGRTKLFEATAKAIKDAEDLERSEGKDTAFLIYVITDGANNDPRYTVAQLRADIERVQKKGNYTLAFMLPPGEKRAFCREFRISEGNVMEWETTKKGVAQASDVQSASIKNYMVSRRAGAMSTDKFYADMSHVSSADVRSALEDISKRCQVRTLWKDERIDDFCRREFGGYLKGAGFYQLMKTEKAVQGYKGILIMEKGKSAIYAGDAARQMLGLPDHTVKLVPGDHANFDIFVQSTSMNRNLNNGTKFIYYPDAAR